MCPPAFAPGFHLYCVNRELTKTRRVLMYFREPACEEDNFPPVSLRLWNAVETSAGIALLLIQLWLWLSRVNL